MKKFFILFMLCFFILTTNAGAAWLSGQRHTYTFMNGRVGAAAISGASVGIVGGYPDTCLMMSGTTFEFAYASIVPPFDINITDAGGVTGWKIAKFNGLQISGLTPYLSGNTAVGLPTLTAYTESSAFSGDTDFATDSQVTGELTSRTTRAAFTGATDFAVNSEVTGAIRNATNLSAFTGVSDFAVDSQVTDFVIESIRNATNATAFTGTTDFATNTELTAHTTTLTGVSGEALKSWVDAATGASVVSGASLTVNQVACSIGQQFFSAASGDSAIVTPPWTFVTTGVSLTNSSGVVDTAGVTVFYGGSAAVVTQISGSGATEYNLTFADTRIPAGTSLRFQIGTVTTGRTWTAQIYGRKE